MKPVSCVINILNQNFAGTTVTGDDLKIIRDFHRNAVQEYRQKKPELIPGSNDRGEYLRANGKIPKPLYFEIHDRLVQFKEEADQ